MCSSACCVAANAYAKAGGCWPTMMLIGHVAAIQSEYGDCKEPNDNEMPLEKTRIIDRRDNAATLGTLLSNPMSAKGIPAVSAFAIVGHDHIKFASTELDTPQIP